MATKKHVFAFDSCRISSLHAFYGMLNDLVGSNDWQGAFSISGLKGWGEKGDGFDILSPDRRGGGAEWLFALHFLGYSGEGGGVIPIFWGSRGKRWGGGGGGFQFLG